MITLLQEPPAYAFSGNFIPLKFETDNFLEDEGQASENFIISKFYLDETIPEGFIMQIRYGSNTLNFTATANPDASGTQIPSGQITAAKIAAIMTCLGYNSQLSNDFVLGNNGIIIIFKAKKKGYGYNFEASTDSIFTYVNDEQGRPEIVRPNFAIQFELFLQDEGKDTFSRIYSNRLIIQPGDEYVASIDIADKLHNILVNDGPDLPDGNVTNYACSKSCRLYYYTYAESYGELIKSYSTTVSSKYTVLAGAFSYLGALNNTLSGFLEPNPSDKAFNRFLSQTSAPVYTRPDQPQYLTWFNTGEAGFYTFNIRFYFINELPQTLTYANAAYGQHRKTSFNVSFSNVFDPAVYPGKAVERYECWIADAADFAVTETTTYWVNYEHQQYARYFLYNSSMGSIESMCCHGKGSAQFELVQQEAKRVRRSDYSVTDGDSVIFDTRLNSGFKAVTGWLTRRQLAANRDFYLASHKYRYFKEQLLPIKISSTTIPEYEDGTNNISQEFEYKYLFDDQAYTEGDVESDELPFHDYLFGGLGKVRIVDQEGNLIQEVQAPGSFQVFRFDTVAGGNAFSTFELKIIKPLK
jgi:hypothetical protein